MDACRTAGNAAVQAGDFKAAADAYSVGLDDEALESDPNRHVVLCNRALCWMKLGEPDLAFRDGLTAIELNPQYVKGWWRVVEGLVGMGQPRRVVMYYLEQLLKLDAKVPEAKKLYSQLVFEEFAEEASGFMQAATAAKQNTSRQQQMDDDEAQFSKAHQEQQSGQPPQKEATAKNEEEPFRQRALKLVAQGGGSWLPFKQLPPIPVAAPAAAGAPPAPTAEVENMWSDILLVLFALIVARRHDDLSKLLTIAQKDSELILASLHGPVVAVDGGAKLWSLLHVAAFGVTEEPTTDASAEPLADLSVLLLMVATHGFDPSRCVRKMRSVLHEASITADLPVVHLCLGRCEDVNSRDSDGCTAFWWACRNGDCDLIQLFLARSTVDCNHRNNKGESPLCCAVMHGNAAAVELLMSLSAVAPGRVDPNQATDGDQLTALHLAASFQESPASTAATRVELVKSFLPKSTRTDIEAVNAQGQRALHYAAMLEDVAVARLLIEQGCANVEARCGHGMSAADYARHGGGAGGKAVLEYLDTIMEQMRQGKRFERI